METIRFGGRTVAGFGLGDAAPTMTAQQAARVSQGWWLPFWAGAAGVVVGGIAGGFTGGLAYAATTPRMSRHEQEAESAIGTGALAGSLVGAGVGAVIAAGFGRRQERASAVLAGMPTAPIPVTV